MWSRGRTADGAATTAGRADEPPVDDDAMILRSLGRGLRLNGFTVALAEDGPTALAELTERPPDVVVLDVSLPPRRAPRRRCDTCCTRYALRNRR
ncbi:response regulator [Streptomyces sp. CA2R101]|uniref:response regulator n=1 Tax=Streptomyces sp. CA2R101 TaxID=3120152 RepID=UPI00300A1636